MKNLRIAAMIAAIGSLLLVVNLNLAAHPGSRTVFGPAFADMSDPTVPIPPPPPPPPPQVA